MNGIAPNDFDYSLLDAKTKEFLEERANIIYGIQSKSAYEIGKQLAKAQKELSTRGYGCFEEWYRSLGFKTTKAYEYINHFKFVSSENEELKIVFSFAERTIKQQKIAWDKNKISKRYDIWNSCVSI